MGLTQFHAWLKQYIQSDPFQALVQDSEELEQVFTGTRYAIQVESGMVTLLPDDLRTDYCSEIRKTFESFSGADFDYQIHFFSDLEMCALETRMTDILQRMNWPASVKKP